MVGNNHFFNISSVLLLGFDIVKLTASLDLITKLKYWYFNQNIPKNLSAQVSILLGNHFYKHVVTFSQLLILIFVTICFIFSERKGLNMKKTL